MYIKSSFPHPDKVPDSNINAYEELWNRHKQARCPDDVILHIDGANGRKRTYQEFHALVILVATALAGGSSFFDGPLGVQSENGAMIGIISDSSSDCAVLVHSLLLLATPFALFDSRWTAFEFENALKLTKPTKLFIQDQVVSKFVPMAESIGRENMYVLGQKIEGLGSFEEMIENARLRRRRATAPISPRSVTKDTLACLVFSSGTTGLPKGVMISHGNIIANVQVARIISPQPPASKIPVRLLNTPICVISGLHSCCFHPFVAPATGVITNDRSVDATLELIARHQVTAIYLHPSFIRQLLDLNLKDAGLSSLRLLLSGGSYFSPELLAKVAITIPHKFIFGQVYGMTEALGITMLHLPISSDETDFQVADSVGKLFPGVEARILREDGSEADVNEAGELYVRSECVALGYWNNEKATRDAFVDDWVRTGDLVRVDQNDFFFIVGRVKDTFKTPAGRQVSPFQIEDELLAEPQKLITDATVAGVRPGTQSEDEEKGKVARAWIVLSDEGKKLGADAVIKELEVWYRKRLSDHKWLHGGIEIVDEIPRTTSGKPMRAVLQERYEERVLAGSGNAISKSGKI